MNHNGNRDRIHAGFKLAALLSVLLLIPALAAQTADNSSGVLSATHVMGFEGVHNNSNGKLNLSSDGLQFQPSEGGAGSEIKLSAIREITVGEEDRQVGGVPMMVGKAAIPYSGGRFVSLFSHKKYDSLTVEYTDANGGLHGAIFRIAKGSGEGYRKELIAKGAHGSSGVEEVKPAANQEVKNESK